MLPGLLIGARFRAMRPLRVSEVVAVRRRGRDPGGRSPPTSTAGEFVGPNLDPGPAVLLDNSSEPRRARRSAIRTTRGAEVLVRRADEPAAARLRVLVANCLRR